MQKIDIGQLLRTRAPLKGMGSLVEATHAIQRALGVPPVHMPPMPPMPHGHHMPDPSAAVPPASAAPPRPRWNSRQATNDIQDATVVNRRPHPTGGASAPRTASAPQATSAGTFTRIALQHGGIQRHYKLLVPALNAGPSAPMPLVVMLHGCTQNPDDFATGTGMNRLGQQHGFLVLYPEQIQTGNAQHCWNWFRPDDQQRGRGEPAMLVAMVHDAMQRNAVDPARVYVAGLSAGGAMAAVLGQQYPDLFAAVGVHSGVVAGGAHDVMSAFSAMKSGAKNRRKAAKPGHKMPTIVFHGDADSTVHPRNGAQVLDAAVHGLPAAQVQATTERGAATQGRTFTRRIHRSQDGTVSAEHWTVHGSGHAWSGGSAAGSYTDPQGPDASAEMWRFFAAHPRRA